MDGQRASEIRKEYASVFESLPQLGDADTSNEDGQRLVMDAGECFDTLIDALNACAPEGVFFGSHPGDGSDFGFWPIESHERALGEEDGSAHSCPRCGEPMPWDCSVCGCEEQDEEESSDEEPPKLCSKCGKRILTAAEHLEMGKWMDADQKFDGGEWSGSHDYYKDICRCDEEEGE